MSTLPKQQAGFTFIELVMVIIIIGLLSVTAAPKILSLKSETKASVLTNIAGAMEASLDLVYATAIIEGKTEGQQTIIYNGHNLKLYNGYPLIDGTSSFTELNTQLTSWLDLDVVDRNTARDNRDAAQFFSDKWSEENQMYLFFTEDYDQKNVIFECQIMYENQIGKAEIQVRVLDSAC